ncbi:MAG: precorrin-3B C(17)-methyltransferase [Syntrophobacteraceae bacterium]|nr:precorrin-3B C(17)-methyltransferase [Syntrophobacteraceae bacterium]
MRSDSQVECPGGRNPHSETEDGKRHRGRGPGELSVISLGPGHRSYMVPEALDALLSASIVFGYKTYIELIAELVEGRTVVSSGMRKEVQRCQQAIDHAVAGEKVALVSSGDAGIYGMAGLVFDLCRERDLRTAPPDGQPEGPVDLFIRVIPGVAAFNAAASLLGAPLMHDFAAVSLSDHLTPWPLIQERLTAASSADFVLAIYNPRSKARPDLLEAAQQVLLRHRCPETPVAIVRQAMRKGQWKHLTTLEEIPFDEVDMQSVVIVGNSRTYVWNGWMVTPRGYLEKYSLSDRQGMPD